MTTVQRILEGAYARSSANDPGKTADETELIPYLNEMYQAYWALLATGVGRERYAQRWVMVLSGGIATLPDDVVDVLSIEYTVLSKINLVPLDEAHRSWHLAPAMYRHNKFLVSLGRTGDPTTGVIAAQIIPAPAALTLLASNLDTAWPVRHNPLLIAELALYLAIKDEGRSAQELKALRDERNAHLQMFYAVNGISTTGQQSPHRRGQNNQPTEKE